MTGNNAYSVSFTKADLDSYDWATNPGISATEDGVALTAPLSIIEGDGTINIVH